MAHHLFFFGVGGVCGFFFTTLHVLCMALASLVNGGGKGKFRSGSGLTRNMS